MKKVLFVAYVFPPLSGPAVQRSLKFVKYLRNFGYEPIVVTCGKSLFNISDDSLTSEIPKDVQIIRIDDEKLKNYTDIFLNETLKNFQYSFEILEENLKQEKSKEIEHKLEELRSMIVFPDRYSLWANKVINDIHKYVDMNEIKVIYTTIDPVSTGLVGYHLKNKYNLPWVIDFRDEWTNAPFINFDKESFEYRMALDMETKYVNYADRIITVSPIISENYVRLFNVPEDKVATITNGYDEEDFKEIRAMRSSNIKFTILYNGTINYKERHPFSLFKAVENLIKDRKILKDKIQILFPNEHIVYEVKEKILDYEFKDIIKWYNYSKHIESLKQANNSDMLLLLLGESEGFKSCYTGKIFEYLRLEKPILALSPEGSLVESLLNETGCGQNFSYYNIKGIEEFVYSNYVEWLNGNSSIMVDKNEVKKYNREFLTKKLSQVFDKLI